MSLLIKAFSPKEVSQAITKIHDHKAPGYDLITGNILKQLPKKAIVLLTIIYNSMLRLSHFPVTWKFAQIIMIPNPGKPANEASSYRSISLLTIPSKIFEKLVLNRIKRHRYPRYYTRLSVWIQRTAFYNPANSQNSQQNRYKPRRETILHSSVSRYCPGL
jgi:hypothetical protein